MIGLFFGLMIAVVVVDLVTKFTVDGILNSGIAWGLGAEVTWLWVVVVAVSFGLVVGLVWWFLRSKQRTWFNTVGLGLFIGGILGNALDRLISQGAVHDFIDFGIFRNNVADIAISVGAVLIVLALIKGERRATR